MPGSHGVHALAAHASPRSLLTGRADWSEPWLHSPAPMTEARGLQPLPLISKSRWSFGPQDRAHRLAPAWGHRMPGSPVRRTQARGAHTVLSGCLPCPSIHKCSTSTTVPGRVGRRLRCGVSPRDLPPHQLCLSFPTLF